MKKPFIILGAGGHAAVIADILFKSRCTLKGFLDDSVEIGTDILGAKVLGKIETCLNFPECAFVIGIGSNHTRQMIAKTYDLDYGIAIHPSAVIGSQVAINAGTVVMAGSIINSRTQTGYHCIFNTASVIEHDSYVNDFVSIAPNATLCGNVHVRTCCEIGAGANIIQGKTIGENTIIGAGSVVTKDIPANCTAVGVPAMPVRYHL